MPSGLVFDLLARDKASATFLRVAESVDKAAVSNERLARQNLAASRTAGQLRIAELEVAAATERHAAVSKSASASVAAQARSEIALIRANQGLAEAQAASSAASLKASRSHSVAQKSAAASTAATKKLTLPLLALGGFAIHEAMQYEKGLATVQIAAGRTNKQMDQSYKGLLAISRETGGSTDQLTESYYVASKAGLSVAKSLDVTRAAQQGAIAEGADLGTVTNALTSIMASYGSKLRDPVKAMDMLVRGAGLAKTTTQEYAGSLSTVVPLASKAGIGFDQVGGALATLTQHGTSAQQATQELAFTIRNLQAPNNVAISAMNQMGISAVDVSKNLGKRGLTGTFDYIESKLPKSALVYIGATKRMEAGGRDLTLMQSKMTPALALASKQFLAGSMSAKDYRSTFKGFGAEGFAQGSAFLSLSSKVKGYSDAVKNGTPAQKTAVSLLKQMMGGAEGLNTWLQLTGESADYFAKSTNKVNDAAKHAGKNVLGFDEVKQTGAFKQRRLIADLKADLIEFGTAALPVFKSVVDHVTDAVQWFDHLSSGTKKLLGYGVLIAAAFGPAVRIMTALGRTGAGLLRFQSGMRGFVRSSDAMGSAAYRNGQRVGQAFTTQAVAADRAALETQAAQTRMTSAVETGALAQSRAIVAGSRARERVARQVRREERLAATSMGPSSAAGSGGATTGPSRLARYSAGVGLAAGIVGPMVGNAISSGSKPGSAASMIGTGVTYAGMGAMIGSFFPGLGTAIGAALGAALGVAQGASGESLFSSPHGAKLNLRSIGRVDQAYKRSLLATGQDGAGSGPKQSYVQGLLGSGDGKKIADDFERVGMTSKDLTLALTGTNKQYDQIIGHYQKLAPNQIFNLASIQKERQALESQNRAAHDQALAGGITLQSMQKQAKFSDILKGKLGDFNKENLTSAQAQAKFATASDAVQASVAANGRTLDRSTTAGRENAVAFQRASAASLQHAEAVYRTTGSTKAASRALATDRTALERLGERLGLTKGDVDKVTDALFNIPANRKSTVIVNTEAALKDLASMKDQFNSIITAMTGRSVTVPMYLKPTKLPGGGSNAGVANTPHGGIVITGGGKPTKHKATGGMVSGPGTGTSDSVPAMMFDRRGVPVQPFALSDGEWVSTAASTAMNRAALAAGNRGAKLIALATGGAVKRAGGGGIYRVGHGWGYDGQYYDKAKDARAAARDAARQAAALAGSPGQRTLVRTDTAAYTAAARSGDLDATKSAFTTLYQDAKAAGASRAALAALSRQERTVVKDLHARAVATERASKATDYLNDLVSKSNDLRTSVRGAFTGTFDIATSTPTMFNDVAGGGSAAAILKSLTAKAAKAGQFGALLTKLGKAGLNRTLLQQLAEAGPTAEAMNAANALMKATPAELAGINQQYTALDAAGQSAGKYVAGAVFGSQIDVAKALLNGYDAKKNPAMAKAVKQLAKSMFGAGAASGRGLEHGLLGQKKAAGDAAYALGREVERQLKKSLHIHSPSRVTRELGRSTGVGFALGMKDTIATVSAASGAMGQAAVPSPSGVPSSSGTGSGDYHDNRQYHFEINEADGGMETAHKVMRRLALSRP